MHHEECRTSCEKSPPQAQGPGEGLSLELVTWGRWRERKRAGGILRRHIKTHGEGSETRMGCHLILNTLWENTEVKNKGIKDGAGELCGRVHG